MAPKKSSSSSSGDSGSFEDSSSESDNPPPPKPPPPPPPPLPKQQPPPQKQQPPPQKQQPRSQPADAVTEDSDTGSTDSDSGSDSDSSDKAPASPRRASRVADPSITPLASKPMAAAATKPAKPSTTPTKRPPPPPQDSDDSDSESESESDPDSPEPSAKPLPTKPSDQSSPLESEEPTKTTPAPVEGSVGKNPGGPDRKPFQRIWGDADEIALFRGLVQYRTDTGSVPSAPSDMDAFLDFIHKSLQIEVSKTQLLNKIRRLKKKYTASLRWKLGSFSKPHLQEMYELSQKIWGSKYASAATLNAAERSVGNSRKRKKTSAEASDASNGRVRKQGKASDGPQPKAAVVGVKCPLMSAAVLQMAGLPHGDSMIRMALDWADEKKALAIEREFEKVVSSEMEHNLAMMRLKVKVGEMIVNARKK